VHDAACETPAGPERYVPAEQLVGATAAVPHHAPAGHVAQVALEVAATAALYEPAAHCAKVAVVGEAQ
jgi:hypothetical protein